MSCIRVLLAEDHNVVRAGLRLLLNAQPDMQVVAEAMDGRQAVAMAHESCPNVAVLDISMPNLDGLQACSLICRDCPDIQVLILTMHESDDYFFQAIQAGASGYLLKKAASEDLIKAVRAVARGEAFFYPSLARRLLEGYLQHGKTGASREAAAFADLSERERQVMFLLAHGMANQEIAEKLVITSSTVQTHRSHILQKLGLKTNVELVRYAISHGLIEG
jgi:two-component system response regulator NreC